MAKIYFVLGKSCSGKDTIFRYLKENTELNLKTVVGYTTRPMRAGETDGVEYFFVNDETAVKMQESGRIVELQLMTDRLTLTVVTGIWL